MVAINMPMPSCCEECRFMIDEHPYYNSSIFVYRCTAMPDCDVICETGNVEALKQRHKDCPLIGRV